MLQAPEGLWLCSLRASIAGAELGKETRESKAGYPGSKTQRTSLWAASLPGGGRGTVSFCVPCSSQGAQGPCFTCCWGENLLSEESRKAPQTQPWGQK